MQPSETLLQGTRIMVTRPTEPADPLVERLRALGAEVIVQPAIRISQPADWQPVDDALPRLDKFDWLVFSSANGVRALLDRRRDRGLEQVKLPRVAAMGPGTAEELARYGFHADLAPEQFRAESLAEALVPDADGKRFLLARASRGRETLAERLTAAGAKVEQIIVYTSDDVELPDPEAVALLCGGKIDWITVTSASIARRVVAWFGDDLGKTRLASIGPITSGVLREQGYQPTVEAAEFTMAGLTAAIVGNASA
jgi:uroporphyrinogen III methyltransferase / synthase